MDDKTRLWLPPLRLSGCLRGAMLRDTRGRVLSETERDNYFPATPLVSLIFWLEGSSEWRTAPGFALPQGEPFESPLMLAGPFTLPSTTQNPGPIHAIKLLFLPDAFAALTGIAPGNHVNQVVDARAVLPPDWNAWAATLPALSDDAARLASIEAFLSARWQATPRPAVERYAAWSQALAVRAATSAAGRSLRQAERRVKAWAGVPMRELRAVSRAEALFLAVCAAEPQGSVPWAELAADHDYADQAHLCRETRRLAGFSPELLRQKMFSEEAFWAYRLWM